MGKKHESGGGGRERERRRRGQSPRSESVWSPAAATAAVIHLALLFSLSPSSLFLSRSLSRASPSFALSLLDRYSGTANAPEGSRTAVTAVDVEPLIGFDEKEREGERAARGKEKKVKSLERERLATQAKKLSARSVRFRLGERRAGSVCERGSLGVRRLGCRSIEGQGRERERVWSEE